MSALYCSYNHYVEIIEPDSGRACIKCCNDPADCPTGRSEQASSSSIHYFADGINAVRRQARQAVMLSSLAATPAAKFSAHELYQSS
jgi:hypothetical protein